MAAPSTQVIHIYPSAPPKPALGQVCNGCGVCCLVEPCPLGIVLSAKRIGACVAVRWNAPAQQYRCGVVVNATQALDQALPAMLRWLAPVLGWPLARLARRWISVGSGCDSSLQASQPLNDNEPHD
jgi:hypothetical protein